MLLLIFDVAEVQSVLLLRVRNCGSCGTGGHKFGENGKHIVLMRNGKIVGKIKAI